MLEFFKWFAIFETGVLIGFFTACIFLGKRGDEEQNSTEENEDTSSVEVDNE